MRHKSATRWALIQSGPTSKSQFVKNILTKKFPHYQFSFFRLSRNRFAGATLFNGIIADMISLDDEQLLKAFDNIRARFPRAELVLIINPHGYQLLQAERKNNLEKSMVVLCDSSSLDYLLQLPRCLEEVARKHRLKSQNERLRRLAKKAIPNFEDKLHSTEASPSALRITLDGWTRLKKDLGRSAENELIDLVSQTINEVVRHSDRVFRSREDEFTVFLHNIDTEQVSQCRERLRQALERFQSSNSQKSGSLPFSITAV